MSTPQIDDVGLQSAARRTIIEQAPVVADEATCCAVRLERFGVEHSPAQYGIERRSVKGLSGLRQSGHGCTGALAIEVGLI